jgi:MerR family mercuric resistance operon transcriptional regulator
VHENLLKGKRMEANAMTIGDLASAAGVNVETVRYYQRLGILPEPPRARGTIRRYPDDALRRLHFIKRAQRLGFSLDEVKILLGLSDGRHCAETRELAERKLAIVEEKLADLNAMHDALTDLISACRRGGRGCGCPLIDAPASDES